MLTDPIRIVIGDLGEANTDITQVGTDREVCLASVLTRLDFRLDFTRKIQSNTMPSIFFLVLVNFLG